MMLVACGYTSAYSVYRKEKGSHSGAFLTERRSKLPTRKNTLSTSITKVLEERDQYTFYSMWSIAFFLAWPVAGDKNDIKRLLQRCRSIVPPSLVLSLPSFSRSPSRRRVIPLLIFFFFLLACFITYTLMPSLSAFNVTMELARTSSSSSPSHHHFFHGVRCFIAALLLFHHVHCVPVPPSTNVKDPLLLQSPAGTVTGADVGDGVTRFTLPFAQPPLDALRFANPQPITVFDVARVNASQTPPQCYQGDIGVRGGNAGSEDCLYTTFYRPASAKANTTKLPVVVWFHGGSGIAGGSTQAGLDGRAWAHAENVIVAFPQYRLGVFGWLQTEQTLDEQAGGVPGDGKLAGNQAMRDAVVSLRQIKRLAASLGGDPNRITVMGQSSGALMVRALLVTPEARTLFTNAVLVSDPSDYGFSSTDDNNALGESAMSYLGCASNDVACARSRSAEDVLEATWTAYSDVPQQNPRVSSGTPWRAVVGSFVQPSNDGGNGKNVIMTTVKNEFGSVVGSNFVPSPIGATTLQFYGGDDASSLTMPQAADLVFNGNRGDRVAGDTSLYAVNASLADAMRTTYEQLGTDGVWRCPTQYKAARNMVAGASNVYLAEWQLGETYPSNTDNDFCTSDGRVCHEDDILLYFGTAMSMNAAQRSASSEVQRRIANFARQNTPAGPSNTVPWQSVKSAQELNMLIVQPDGTTIVEQTHHAPACSGPLWGDSVQFDYQMYPS